MTRDSVHSSDFLLYIKLELLISDLQIIIKICSVRHSNMHSAPECVYFVQF